MIQLTVGYVAGFIAAAFFVARLWSPNILALILSGILRDSNSAATWSVAGRALHKSNWPSILQSDTARNYGVRSDVLWMTRWATLMSLLISIAAVVTPLGLYQALVDADPVKTTFRYLKDTSPFGIGTPPRTNYSQAFTRSCQGMFSLAPCPFTDTIAIAVMDSRGNGTWDFPNGYDINVPKSIEEAYSSGTSNDTTISNYFDIEWRRYVTTNNDNYNNGSTYAVGAFRLFESLALTEAYIPVEGLIVDTINGGIGFRNHTIPPGFRYGASWEEDLLFIVPETVCVDTNTTLDYSVAAAQNTSISFTDIVLTDRGGFVNLNHTYPEANLTDTQRNPDLWTRAYKGAWMTNAYTMVYFNVTNPRNGTLHAFSYVDSVLGKTFSLPNYDQPSYYDSLGMDNGWSFHLDIGSSIGNISSPGDSAPPSNPWDIQQSNFSDIALICGGSGGMDFANITNILVGCGLMHGLPQRQDTGSSLIFDSGSRWSQPLYSCATAAKATIKTVTFSFNGTDQNLKNLNVTSVKDKVYPDEKSKPLWGVEDTGNAYNMDQMKLIWGLVSSQYENHPNVSTVRQESLYLPGWGSLGASMYRLDTANLPASDFYAGAIGEGYDVGLANTVTMDYSGNSNMAMWVRWQQLSSTPQTATKIPNLIFTDYAAGGVVGTKGVLGPRNAGHQNAVSIPVTPTLLKIRYHYPFGIPAFLSALGILLATVVAFIVLLFGRGGISKMRDNLHHTSPGRIFTTFLHPKPGGMITGSREWTRQLGKRGVDLSGDYPLATEGGPVPEKGVKVTERSASEADSAEGETFLIEQGGLSPAPHHTRYQSEGDVGGHGFVQPQQYGGMYSTPGASGRF